MQIEKSSKGLRYSYNNKTSKYKTLVIRVNKIYRVFMWPSLKVSMGISKTVHRADRMAHQVRAHIPPNLTS